ncbi:MAG: putative membrane protein [Cyclobacteriaceae bacterium]|jgi:uncharacterized membrane protein
MVVPICTYAVPKPESRLGMSKSPISRALLSVFFLIGGFNHFINPDFYLPLIPPSLRYLGFINLVSGLLEIAAAIGLWIPKLKRATIYALIALMLAFIPSHIYFIQLDSCVEHGLCVSNWVGWIRLIVIHPLLIYWIISVRNS